MQVGSLKKGKEKGKGKHQGQKRKSNHQHDQHELHRHQHVQELWQNWTMSEGTAGDQVEERTTIPPVTATRRKARVHKKGRGKSEHVDVVETN